MSDPCTCCSDTVSNIPVKIKAKLRAAKIQAPASEPEPVQAQAPKSKLLPRLKPKSSTTTSNSYGVLPDNTGKAVGKHGAGGKSFNGTPIRELKSAVQKYIRRGDIRSVHYAIDYSMIGMFLFPDYAGDYKASSIKGAITNLLNRLRIIAIEDVGLGAPNAPAVVESLIGPLDKYKNAIPLGAQPTMDKLITPIMLATDYLRRCAKIRTISYLKTAFVLPPYSLPEYDMRAGVIKDLGPDYTGISTIATTDNGMLDLSLGLDFFAGLSRYLAANISSGAIGAVWTKLQQSPKWGKWKDTMLALKKLSAQGYSSGSGGSYNEKIIAMYHAALILIIDPVDVSPGEPDKKLLSKVYQDVISMQVPEYEKYLVEDRHTRAGGSLMQFAYVGAYVNNPMYGYMNYKYDMLYNEIKVYTQYRGKYRKHHKIPIIPHKSQEIVKLTGLTKAQLLTSKSKVPTYISRFQIYKGPYTQKHFDDKSSRFNKCIMFTEMLQDMEEYLGLVGYTRTTIPLRYIAEVIDDTSASLNGYYLVWDNIGDYDALKVEQKESAINPMGPVMVKGSMLKNLNDATLTERHKIAAVQHLYLRYVSGLGDSGPWNMLVRHNPAGNMDGQIVVGVDLEDMRGPIKSTETPMNLLMTKSSEKYQRIYGPYVKDIIQMPNGESRWGADIQQRISLFHDVSSA